MGTNQTSNRAGSSNMRWTPQVIIDLKRCWERKEVKSCISKIVRLAP
jgi:hypothetical protein